jgi:hypothetical protein
MFDTSLFWHFKHPVFVYWLMNDIGISKIGHSEEPVIRLNRLRNDIDSEFTIMHAIPFKTKAEAESFERITQAILDEYTVRFVNGKWVVPSKTYWYDEYFKAPTWAIENAMRTVKVPSDIDLTEFVNQRKGQSNMAMIKRIFKLKDPRRKREIEATLKQKGAVILELKPHVLAAFETASKWVEWEQYHEEQHSFSPQWYPR